MSALVRRRRGRRVTAFLPETLDESVARLRTLPSANIVVGQYPKVDSLDECVRFVS